MDSIERNPREMLGKPYGLHGEKPQGKPRENLGKPMQREIPVKPCLGGDFPRETLPPPPPCRAVPALLPIAMSTVGGPMPPSSRGGDKPRIMLVACRRITCAAYISTTKYIRKGQWCHGWGMWLTGVIASTFAVVQGQ